MRPDANARVGPHAPSDTVRALAGEPRAVATPGDRATVEPCLSKAPVSQAAKLPVEGGKRTPAALCTIGLWLTGFE
jgi:hypothetical protein